MQRYWLISKRTIHGILQNIRPYDNIVKMLSNWGKNNNNIEIMNVTANQAKISLTACTMTLVALLIF